MRDLHLSQAAGLFLLQGGSLKQLLDNAFVLEVPDVRWETVEGFEGILVFSDLPALHRPPIVLKKVVFARPTKRPSNMTDVEFAQSLLFFELGA